MSEVKVTTYVLKEFPKGKVTEATFSKVLSTVKIDSIPDDGVLVENLWLSVDPYVRGRLTDKKTYGPTVPIGGTIIGSCIGRVIKVGKDVKDLKEGDMVSNQAGWTTHLSASGDAVKGIRKIPPVKVPLHYFLSVLGVTGFTAWIGLNKIGKPKKGDVVFVSGAAGATGLVAGQLAKAAGCTVVGSAGSDEKVKFLKELGFDRAFNYKTGKLSDSVEKNFPDGIDVYYDNVGGEMLELAISKMNNFGRIVLCGAISQYQVASEERYGIKNTFQIIGKRLTVGGFIISDHFGEMGTALGAMGKLIAEGKLKERTTITKGFENTPKAFMGLFSGSNVGKALVQIKEA